VYQGCRWPVRVHHRYSPHARRGVTLTQLGALRSSHDQGYRGQSLAA
jgi:hypothetical protein